MPGGNKEQTVLIVEDDYLVAKSIARLLSISFNTKVAGTKSDALQALSQVGDLRAIIVDVCLPDGSGLDVAEEARRGSAALPIVVITGFPSREVSFRTLSLGARLLIKPFDKYHIEIIRDFLAGIPSSNIDEYQLEQSGSHELTSKQKEVLSLAVADYDRQSICERMDISPATLRTHVRRILKRCDAINLQEVVKRVRSKTPHPYE